MMRVICQFKILTIIVLSFFVLSSKGQVYQSMPQYGYSGPRFNMDSTLSIPTVCGVPTLKSNLTKKAAIAFDSCNNRFYQYNPKTLAWSQITGGGGTTIDTTKYLKIDSLIIYGPLYKQIFGQEVALGMYASNNEFDGYLQAIDFINFSNKVDTIYRTPGKDSIQFTIAGRYRAIKDSSSGVASRLVTSVYNNSGSTIAKGSVIYINGRHSSNYPTIALAQANTEANSYSTFAMVQDDILNNSVGTVIQAGNISNLNLPTATYTDGQLVYLSPTVAGGITTTKPLAPYHIVKIGTITRAHPTLGSIELKIENGWQLDELSDVKIAAVPLDSTILQFSRVDSLWHDVNPTTAMGNRFIKISDSAAMLSKYLRKTDTTNKFVNSISRVQGKDSIIFYIGSTRYAIKDSTGNIGGAAGPEYAVQYKSADGFMSGDVNFTWKYQTKKLGIGTDDPEVTLDVSQGQKGNVPLNYESASFQRDAEVALGVYNSSNYSAGTGSSILLGNSKNTNADNKYPSFQMRNVNDSNNWFNNYVQFNYQERNTSGTFVSSTIDLFKVYANGIVQLNPYGFSHSPSPRLIVGEDNYGAMLETSGDAFINGRFITQSSRQKYVNYLADDVIGSTYYVNADDHIIIYVTDNNNCTITLPASPENGRELVIKHAGDVGVFNLTVDANGWDIYDTGSGTATILSDSQPNSVTIVYYDGVWYTISGQWN